MEVGGEAGEGVEGRERAWPRMGVSVPRQEA